MDYCWWLYAGRTRSKCGGTGLLITGGRRARARAARCVLVVVPPQPQPRVTHRTLDTGYRCVLNHGGVTHRTCLTNAILKHSLDSGYRKSIRLDVISTFDLGHAGNPFGYIHSSPIWSIFFTPYGTVSHHQCSKKYKLNNAQTKKWNSSSGAQKSYT